MRVVFHAVLLLAFVAVGSAQAASSTIQGFVKDANTGDGLPGATVLLKGTSMGASTELNGHYRIKGVPEGTYTVRVSYIGYKSEQETVKVGNGVTMTKDFRLSPVGIQGKKVVVTAQANGQAQAINEELSSNRIINAVSAAKIRQLPDANAAESVGRLPGVFVLRSGGEGYKVVIRGMAPQYNEITINGIQMSSSDPTDRSTNLSMISSNMLAGIQVSKTVTPAMDANVIGGVVNFAMREAHVKKPGVPRISLVLQGGYNSLPDAYHKFNNYKYVGSIEDRFLNDKLGVFAQADVERLNLSSNELGNSYTHYVNSTTKYVANSVELFDIPRDVLRYNGALDLDYEYSGGSMKMMNFVSTGRSNSHQRSESFDIGSNMIYYGLGNSNSRLTTLSDVFDLKQKLPVFNMDLKLGHTYSETKDPNNWGVQFSQTSAGLSQFNNELNINPQSIPKAATLDPSSTYLYYLDNTYSISRSRALTASLDLKTSVDLSDAVSALIQFGGEFRYMTRSYLFDEYDTAQLLDSGSASYVDNLINSYFHFPLNNTQLPITDFVDPSFSYGNFLGGSYAMNSPLSYGMLSQMIQMLEKNAGSIANSGNEATYGHDNYASTINNYSGKEYHNAAYGMATLKLGPQLTAIGGIRYQGFRTVYTGVAGVTGPEAYLVYNHYDTTMTRNNGYWLPDITLRYKPLTWADLRLSYTNTLAYPSFGDFVPKINLSGIIVGWNNYGLVPAHSQNYDLYASVYDNTIGLFTAGVFLKRIKNMIYSWNFFVKGAGAQQYLPRNLPGFNPNITYQVYTTENNPYINTVDGLELDWETHFWYLPGVLSGLVLDANYTHTYSKARYPYVYQISTGRAISYIDTSFTDRLVDQPNNIFNLSLGFDYEGFSVRVAMLYQADIFTSPNQWPQLRGYTAAYRRWDVAARQKLPWPGLQLYVDLNNINGANDVRIIAAGPPTAIEDYGFTGDLGLRYEF